MIATASEEADTITTTDEGEANDVGLGKEEQKHRFVMLRAKGYSYARIARELGVSKGTLTAWNAELEAEIAKARAMELEALQEEFFLLKEGRIRLIGEQLRAILCCLRRNWTFPNCVLVSKVGRHSLKGNVHDRTTTVFAPRESPNPPAPSVGAQTHLGDLWPVPDQSHPLLSLAEGSV
jgi:transposase-like protein